MWFGDPWWSHALHLAQVSNDFQLQGSLDFHDLNEDNEVTEAHKQEGDL